MSEFFWASIVLIVLNGGTWIILKKYFQGFPFIRRLFLIVVLVHVAAVFFIHYAQFYPYGKGDQILYDAAAVEIAENFRNGNPSWSAIEEALEKNYAVHKYPVVLGTLYALTTPEDFVGMAFTAWLSVLAVLMVYLIAYEISGSPNGSFLAGVAATFYPSYIFFGSLLLKDTLLIPLVLVGLLCLIKITKHFQWRYVFLLFAVLFPLFDLRFYIALALVYTVLLSWPFLMGLNLKKKIVYGILVLVPLGFIPYFFGNGYYSSKMILQYTKPEKIFLYRDSIYLPNPLKPDVIQKNVSPTPSTTQQPVSPSPTKLLASPSPTKPRVSPSVTKQPVSPLPTVLATPLPTPPPSPEVQSKGPGSTVIIESGVDSPISFVRNYIQAFSYVSFGPFPWHIRYARQYSALLETIPWLVALFFIIRGMIQERKKWRIFVPLVLFSGGVLVILALIVASNFGIYMRLRMPAFLALIPFLAISFNQINTSKIYEYLSRWWGRIYRIAPR